jgi:uncharacterized membrane protein
VVVAAIDLAKGNAFSVQNRERLRALLGEVMIRNTRSLADVRLPRRHASTLIVEPEEVEVHGDPTV